MSMHRRLVLILGLVELTTWGLVYYVPAVSTAAVVNSLNTTPAAVLGAFSLALLVTGLASPAVCRWIDRRGGRGIMLVAALVSAAGLVVLATAETLTQWYVGWAIAGLGMAGGLYDPALATAGRLMGAQARPTLTGIAMIGGFASTIGWPLGVATVEWLGWRSMLLAYAAALLVINVPLLLALPRHVPPATRTPRPTTGGPRGGTGLFLCLAAFFTTRAVINTTISVNGLELFTGLGLSVAGAVGVLSLIGPSQVGMRVIQSWLGGSWDPVLVACVSAALVPLVTFLLAIAAGSPLAGTAAALFVIGYGLSNGILTIARGVLPLHLFGPTGYATRIGQLALPVVLAQAATPLVMAPVVHGVDGGTAMLLLGVISILSGLCLVPIWRRRPG